MRKRFEESPIQSEVAAERPEVFDEESWETVRSFSYRYAGLREVPGFNEINNLGEITEAITKATKSNIELAAREVLESTAWSVADKENIVRATTDEEAFAVIEEADNPTLLKTSLGMRLIAERARAESVAESLRALDEKTLKKFGMSPGVRDLIADVIPKLAAANGEYLRLYARGAADKDAEEQPIDAIRERRRLHETFAGMAHDIEEGGTENLFGRDGSDFVAYLRGVAGSYRAENEQGKRVTHKEQIASAKESKKQLNDFYAEHPDFPLVVMSKTESYLGEGLERDLGLDPEARIAWRSPKQIEEGKSVESFRDAFANILLERFPKYLSEDHVRAVRGVRAYVATDLAGFGINMTFRAEAQDLEKWVMLFDNIKERIDKDKTGQYLRAVLPKNSLDLLDHPDIHEASKTLTFFHEFLHRVYPEEGTAGERLGDLDDDLAETKSDTVARAVFSDLYRQHAKQMFGDRAQEAMNIVMLGDDLYAYLTSSSRGETFPYWLGAATRLNHLAKKGVLRTNEKNVAVDEVALTKDFSPLFLDHAEDILNVYCLAEKGGSSLSKAKKIGQHIADEKPSSMVELLSKQLHRL